MQRIIAVLAFAIVFGLFLAAFAPSQDIALIPNQPCVEESVYAWESTDFETGEVTLGTTVLFTAGQGTLNTLTCTMSACITTGQRPFKYCPELPYDAHIVGPSMFIDEYPVNRHLCDDLRPVNEQ